MTNDLRERIRNEMKTDYVTILGRHFDVANHLLKITDRGTVVVLHRDKLTGEETILLYLIGKQYAKEAEFSDVASVKNDELMHELNIKMGSLKPWTKRLRDAGKILSVKTGSAEVAHEIQSTLIEKTLKEIAAKVGVVIE